MLGLIDDKFTGVQRPGNFVYESMKARFTYKLSKSDIPALRAGPGLLVLTLQSGNFGVSDFITRAAAVLTSNS